MSDQPSALVEQSNDTDKSNAASDDNNSGNNNNKRKTKQISLSDYFTKRRKMSTNATNDSKTGKS